MRWQSTACVLVVAEPCSTRDTPRPCGVWFRTNSAGAIRKPVSAPKKKLDRPGPDLTYTWSLRPAPSERSEPRGEVAERLKAAVC